MSGLLHLTWNNHSLSLTKNICNLQSKGTFCDVTIACNGKYFPVHRLVLSACSEYFEEILKMTPCRHPFIIIKDIEEIDLQALLDFMYKGEVDVYQHRVSLVIKAAETLKIKGLVVSENSSLVEDKVNIPSSNGQTSPNKSPIIVSKKKASKDKPTVMLTKEAMQAVATHQALQEALLRTANIQDVLMDQYDIEEDGRLGLEKNQRESEDFEQEVEQNPTQESSYIMDREEKSEEFDTQRSNMEGADDSFGDDHTNIRERLEVDSTAPTTDLEVFSLTRQDETCLNTMDAVGMDSGEGLSGSGAAEGKETRRRGRDEGTRLMRHSKQLASEDVGAGRLGQKKEDKNVNPRSQPSPGRDPRLTSGECLDGRRSRRKRKRALASAVVTAKRKRNAAAEKGGGAVAPKRPEKESLAWLRVHTAPWDEVLRAWAETRAARRSRIASARYETLAEVLAEWPALGLPTGHVLIEADFQFMYPGKEGGLAASWATLCRALYAKYRAEVDTPSGRGLLDSFEYDTLSVDARDAAILGLIPEVCQPPAVRAQPGNAPWTPTAQESKEAFLLHVKTSSELASRVACKRKSREEKGLPLQPFVALVGPSLSDIRTRHVYVDGVLYELPSVLSAVDLCFKCFHVLHAAYPAEATQVWMFLQLAAYGMATPWDERSPEVENLMASLKKGGEARKM